MKSTPLVYIAVTDGKQRLEINGTLDLFKKFMAIASEPTAPLVYNPAPVVDEITTQAQY